MSRQRSRSHPQACHDSGHLGSRVDFQANSVLKISHHVPSVMLACCGCNLPAPWQSNNELQCFRCDRTWIGRAAGWDRSRQRRWYCATCLLGLTWEVNRENAQQHICSSCRDFVNRFNTPPPPPSTPSPYAARLSPQVQQPSAILRLGERVKLQNLQLKAYLNDRKGECIRLLDSGRCEVRLDTGEVLAVKPANLEIELEARVTKGDRVVNSEEGDFGNAYDGETGSGVEGTRPAGFVLQDLRQDSVLPSLVSHRIFAPRDDGYAERETYRAIDAFSYGACDGYLSVAKDDEISVYYWEGADDSEPSGWCYGECRRSVGWLPQRVVSYSF